MISRTLSFLASILLAAMVVSGPALAEATSQAQPDAAAKGSPPDLSGTWRLDRSRSDHPRSAVGSNGGERGSRRGAGTGAAWAGRRDEGDASGQGASSGRGSAGAQAAHRAVRLPELFSLVQSEDSIVVRDSSNAVVRNFAITGEVQANPAGAEQLHGAWKGQDFVVETQGPRGTVRETYELADAGQTLKITTRVEPGGGRKPFEMTRVYKKVSG